MRGSVATTTFVVVLGWLGNAAAKTGDDRVVNGEDALEGRYPWVVALEAMVSAFRFARYKTGTKGGEERWDVCD
jgi:hypothetical protein